MHQIKANNLKSILLSLLSLQRATKMDLSLRTGLSNTTLSDGINNLQKAGLVAASGLEDSSSGRPPAIYSVNAGYGVCIGLLIQATGLQVAVTDFSGDLLQSYFVEKSEQASLINAVFEAVESTINSFKEKNILAIGIALSGSIDQLKGIVIRNDQLDWYNVHLKELLERKYLIHTYIDHKVNAATLFESKLGTGKNSRNFLCVYPGESDKAGLFLDGTLIRGENNASGKLQAFPGSTNGIAFLTDFLSLEFTVVGTKEGDTFSRAEGHSIVPKQIESWYFERAAAVMALTCWYDMIYSTLGAKVR